MPQPPEDEVARLVRENRALNEQVKKLVRAERRLALSQQSLDRQLQDVQALNDFALAAASAEDVDDILGRAIEVLLSVYPYEQGLALVREDGAFRISAVSAVPGLEARPADGESFGSISTDASTWPARPRLGTADELRSTEPALRGALALLPAVFDPAGASDAAQDASLAVLPIRIQEHDELALILVRRVGSPLSLLEALPTEADLPFLTLVGAHAAIAIQNVRSLEKSREAVRLRDEFLSIASHELKTPLTSLVLLLHALRRTGHLDEGAAATLSSIERQSRLLTNLVNQLLDVSRIRVGRLTPRMAAADLAAIVRGVVARAEADLERSGSTLALTCPDSLAVWADAAQLEQVVASLVSNAVKFGEGKLIQVRVASAEDRAVLEVVDHGRGISPEDQRRVFGRFERGVSSQYFGGLGLGLYIARQLVEAHGGSIRVESAPGRGAKFTVELPRRLGAAAQPATNP